jgi:hypothetical protein
MACNWRVSNPPQDSILPHNDTTRNLHWRVSNPPQDSILPHMRRLLACNWQVSNPPFVTGSAERLRANSETTLRPISRPRPLIEYVQGALYETRFAFFRSGRRY